MKFLGEKVIIRDGPHRGNEGYVIYEDRDAIVVAAPELIGGSSWYGKYYVRKDMVNLSPEEGGMNG